MAVNKNFVVKNGLEVSTDLIIADATTNKVGIASTAPRTELDVRGGIAATDINVSGVGTIVTLQSTTGTITNLISTNANVGLATIGFVTATNIFTSGVSTFVGLATFSSGLQVVSGVTTLGITTATQITTPNLNVSGVGTIAALIATSSNVTSITGVAGTITTFNSTTGNITNLTGTNVNYTGISTLTNVRSTTLVNSGVTTLGSVQISSGIITAASGVVTFYGDGSGLINTPPGSPAAPESAVQYRNSGLFAGSSNFTFDGTTVNIANRANIGVASVGLLTATDAYISGITTVANLNVLTGFDVYDTTATFHSNVRIDGNLSIGGTATVITAQDLKVVDRDIVLGITTDLFGNDLSTDTTANHGGIAVASTEGSPLVSLRATGINTLPDTYKQIMWVAQNTYGAGTTDAWLFNYAVGIGSTQVPNGVRLAVNQTQFTDDTINTLNISASQNLSVSGRSSLGVATASQLNVSGITTLGNIQISSGIITTTASSFEIYKPVLFNYSEKVNVIGNTGAGCTINLANGAYVTATLNQSTTFTFTTGITTGAIGFALQLTNGTGGPYSITWPASVYWPNNTTPTRTTTDSKTDVWVFTTIDNGTKWYGNLALYNFS